MKSKTSRTEFTILWTRVMETPMSMLIGSTKPFLHTKKIRAYSLWSRWLLRSVLLQHHMERDPFGDDIIVYFKHRKDTVYLIKIEWVDKAQAIKCANAPIRAAKVTKTVDFVKGVSSTAVEDDFYGEKS